MSSQQNIHNARSESNTELLLSEVIAALSYALDLTGGQPEGHASRSCVLGMRIGQELRLTVEQSSSLFYGLLLKDESGDPDGLSGNELPLLTQIVNLAKTVEVFASNAGIEAAYNVALDRRGTCFDAKLIRALMKFRRDEAFWEMFFADDPNKSVASLKPADQKMRVDGATLDRIAHGFALVIDAKSPWTYKHSEGVATIAAGIAQTMEMSPNEIRDIRRAGLLHDVGKLGVSNMILDKPGKLSPEEIAEMRKHTAYTYKILHQVAGFRHLASMAASHHERLDGKGYHRGLGADDLPTASRILAVADMYEALTARRPYRQDLSPEQVTDILDKNVGPGICPIVFAALNRYLANGGYVPEAIAA